MSRSYINGRWIPTETINNFTQYIHKTMEDWKIVVDVTTNMFTRTIESPTYVSNHVSNFVWEPIES